MRALTTAVMSLMVLGSACYSSSDGLEQIEERMGELNDTVLQGPDLVLQGSGLVLQGAALVFQGSGLVFQGGGLVFQGTEFSGTFMQDGVTKQLSGMDFIGAEFDLRFTAMVNGQQVVEDLVLRINDITPSETQDDVLLYDLTYRSKNSATWLPYCGQDNVAAIPLQNAWNPTTGDRIDNPDVVSFACTNAALAKCVLWGYKPWTTAVSCDKDSKKTPPKDQWKAKHCTEISLQDHHQACTRMARADYCGNGQPMTVNGTLIDIWDKLAPPIQTQFTDWQVEAEWNPDGAACVNYARHPELGYPSCFLKKNGKPDLTKKCGKLKNQASLLLNSYSPDGL